MKHPGQDQWALHLAGEASHEAKQELLDHLKECPACAAEFAGWQRTLARLDHWKLPSPRRSTRDWRIFKWGIAAALLLGAGIAIGRSSSPFSRAAQVTLEASLKESLLPEMRRRLEREFSAELQSALASNRAQITNELQTAVLQSIDQAFARLGESSSAESRRSFTDLLKVVADARAEDRQAMLALVERVQQRHAADCLALRKDLETVAALTDDELRRTRQGLLQFAAGK
jgi:hypothetical protein